MALAKQSEWALGRKQAPVSREARGVVTERFTITVDADLAAGDIIELGVLSAYHFVTDAVFVSDALGTASNTADIGIMSGDVGDDDDARTCGNELFDGTGIETANVARMANAPGFRIDPTSKDRSIGVKVNSAVTASGQELTLILSSVQ